MAERTIPGTVRQGERPVWQPLVDVVGDDLAGWFMWMYEIELADRSPLHAYKHISTRRYLHLSEDRRAFLYRSEDAYDEIPLLRAIHLVFGGWEVPDPE
jgi:hypothetical protein